MEISGLPYLARAADAVPFNAVVSLDREVPVPPESVSTALMPGNEESSTLRDLPARDVKNVMHPSLGEGLTPVMFDPNTGMRHVGFNLDSQMPALSMYEGKGHILDHWA